MYTTDCAPRYVSGEYGLEKNPIPVNAIDDRTRLSPASRINFAMHYPIQHNVKVKDLGMVAPEAIPTLVYYAKQELGW